MRRLADLVRFGWWLWWIWCEERMTTPIAETIYEAADLLAQLAARLRRLAGQTNAQHARDREAMTAATTGAGVAAGEDFADVSRQLDALRAEVAALQQRIDVHLRERERGT